MVIKARAVVVFSVFVLGVAAGVMLTSGVGPSALIPAQPGVGEFRHA